MSWMSPLVVKDLSLETPADTWMRHNRVKSPELWKSNNIILWVDMWTALAVFYWHKLHKQLTHMTKTEKPPSWRKIQLFTFSNKVFFKLILWCITNNLHEILKICLHIQPLLNQQNNYNQFSQNNVKE